MIYDIIIECKSQNIKGMLIMVIHVDLAKAFETVEWSN